MDTVFAFSNNSSKFEQLSLYEILKALLLIFVYFLIYQPIMKHPNKWTIAKLRNNEGVHHNPQFLHSFWQVSEFISALNYTWHKCISGISQWTFFIGGKGDVLSYAYYYNNCILRILVSKYGRNFCRVIFSVAG